jgi:hypothetical protein
MIAPVVLSGPILDWAHLPAVLPSVASPSGHVSCQGISFAGSMPHPYLLGRLGLVRQGRAR